MKFYVMWILKMFELDMVAVLLWACIACLCISLYCNMIVLVSMLIYLYNLRLLYKSVPECCPIPTENLDP